MDIPQFPDSREITLQDKPLFDSIFSARPPELSAYTFTNLFAWAVPYGTTVSRVDDWIVVQHERDGCRLVLEPLGEGDAREAVEKCFERAGNARIEFERLHSGTASLFEGDKAYSVARDRDDSDYLYLAEDLINLNGRKYDAKRNFINRFKSDYDYEYFSIDAGSAAECLEFAHEWCEDRSCETQEGLKRELCAVYQMLTNFDTLGICGGGIRTDGRIVAFSLGEQLNPETMVVHVEKADSSIAGVYQTINNEFCIHEAAGYKYINREQDLGVPGLRKAKKSYHPVGMIEAFDLKRA